MRKTVRMSKETRDALDAIATALDLDRGCVVNEALTSYIETHQWQVEHIRHGLREAEDGNFIPDAQAKKVIGRLRRK